MTKKRTLTARERISIHLREARRTTRRLGTTENREYLKTVIPSRELYLILQEADSRDLQTVASAIRSQ